MTIDSLIVRYGLLAVFLGAATEGDATLLLTGVAAHLGLLGLPAALTVGALGGFAGDIALFGAGRQRAAAIRRSFLYKRTGPVIERFVDRIGVWQIAVARFVYGTRIATMLFWGVRGLRFWRFVAIDLAGCALWAVAVGGVGYLASNSAAAMLGRVRRIRLWLLGALLLSAVALLAAHLIFWWRRRKASAPRRRRSAGVHVE
jgi:membrane protein DedA with SNARE-associated domain